MPYTDMKKKKKSSRQRSAMAVASNQIGADEHFAR